MYIDKTENDEKYIRLEKREYRFVRRNLLKLLRICERGESLVIRQRAIKTELAAFYVFPVLGARNLTLHMLRTSNSFLRACTSRDVLYVRLSRHRHYPRSLGRLA